MKPETFTARIYGTNVDEFQDVFVYVRRYDADDYGNPDPVVDCEIKIPIYIKPDHVRDDVDSWLYDYDKDLTLGNLKFQVAPHDKQIAI